MIGAGRAALMGDAGSGGGVPEFVAMSTPTDAASAASITLNKPAGIQSGDFLVAYIAKRTAVNAGTPPTGWTLYGNYAGSTSTTVQSILWKVASGSEPSTYVFPHASSVAAKGVIAAYRGPTTAAGFLTTNALDSAAGTGTSLIAYHFSGTASSAGLRVCWWLKFANASANRTIVEGTMTERLDHNGTQATLVQGDEPIVAGHDLTSSRQANDFPSTSAQTCTLNMLLRNA